VEIVLAVRPLPPRFFMARVLRDFNVAQQTAISLGAGYPHSITSSARASSMGGTSRPSAFGAARAAPRVASALSRNSMSLRR
jgi:hypothetical protein